MTCCENIPKSAIQLTQGDDSNALGQNISITIDTEEAMTGWYAIVQLENFQWRYENLTSGTPIEWVIPRDITAQLETGAHTGAIKIFDSSDLCRTVKKDIQVFVNEMVVANPPEPEPEPSEVQDGE